MNGTEVVKDPLNVAGPPVVSHATGMPNSLADLLYAPNGINGQPIVFDPVSRRGWRGPYLVQATGRFKKDELDESFHTYGNPDDPVFVDGMGNPIILQWPNTLDPIETRAKFVRLVSAGLPTKLLLGKQVSAIDVLANKLMPTKATVAMPNLPDERGNDIILFIRVQDEYP